MSIPSCGASGFGHTLVDATFRVVVRLWMLLAKAVDGVHMTREDYVQRVGQLVDGMILSGDASFKYAKVIRLTSAHHQSQSKPIQGIFTILNEYEQASSIDRLVRSLGEIAHYL